MGCHNGPKRSEHDTAYGSRDAGGDAARDARDYKQRGIDGRDDHGRELVVRPFRLEGRIRFVAGRDPAPSDPQVRRLFRVEENLEKVRNTGECSRVFEPLRNGIVAEIDKQVQKRIARSQTFLQLLQHPVLRRPGDHLNKTELTDDLNHDRIDHAEASAPDPNGLEDAIVADDARSSARQYGQQRGVSVI